MKSVFVSAKVTRQRPHPETQSIHSEHGRSRGKYIACDYVGIVSGNKVPDKFARAGFHATRSEFVDAPLIDELSVAVECKLKDYNPETCILRGEIVNVSVDERVLDQNGKVDASKVIPVIFDPFNNDYLKVGEKVGNAFSDGKALK